MLTVHQMVDDATSREVLVTDLLTAFGQRLAGGDIVLEPATTGWREWSQRCAALAAHPAVLDRRNYWIDNAATATLRVASVELAAEIAGAPGADDLIRLAIALTPEQTSQVDNARRILQSSAEEILLAALARTLAITVGDGVAAVDLAGAGRSVLRPEVDLRRTIGWFSTIYPIALPCMDRPAPARLSCSPRSAGPSRRCRTMGSGTDCCVICTPRPQGCWRLPPPPDIFVSYLGMIPEWRERDAPVQFDSDTELTVRETLPGLGHPLELRAFRHGGVLHVDWWYDRRRVRGGTVEALAEQFPATLIALIDEAVAGDEDGADSEADDEALALVDLSAAILDDDE